MNPRGKLYLIPTTLGESAPQSVLPGTVFAIVNHLWDFIVENDKTARRFIKSVQPEKKQSELRLQTLNKHTTAAEWNQMLQPCLEGRDVGLMSEAGCPGVADPGAVVVQKAHEIGIQVVPLVGPSSILLAVMASGMNGQQFAFNGYLPIDKSERKQAIKFMEKISAERDQTQLCIETPYRNNAFLEELIQTVNPQTLVGVACDLTLPTEYIKTQTAANWKKAKLPDLHKRPCIFLFYKN